MCIPVFAQVSSERYGIVDYEADFSGNVTYIMKRTGLLGIKYTRFRTICSSGDFMTLFPGEGGTAEEAIRDSAIKGRAALLINGTGDDAPRIACELAGLAPGSSPMIKPEGQAKPR